MNAHRLKTLPGRKSYVLDCQWLQQWHSYILLSGSFSAKNQVCVLRGYIQQQDGLITYFLVQDKITYLLSKYLCRINYIL